MKQILFLTIVAIFYRTKVNAQDCGLTFGGPIVQQVTKHGYIHGLFWHPSELLYVDRKDPQVCHFLINGTDKCYKLEGIQNASSIYDIKDNTTHKILFADKKVWLWSPDSLIAIKNVTQNDLFDIIQTTTDRLGRTLIGIGSDDFSKVAIFKVFNTHVDSRTAMKNRISGIACSSDFKNVFIARDNVIYKYDYDSANAKLKPTNDVVYDKDMYYEFPGNISTIAVTSENEIWISTNDSAVIMLFDWMKKKIVQTVKIPSRNPTSISYGGDNLDVLFVGTKESKDGRDLGGGAVYAISGTGTKGFQTGAFSKLPKWLS